jgi:hypothetical protein
MDAKSIHVGEDFAFSENFSSKLYPMVGNVSRRVTQFRKLQSVQHSVQHFVGTVKVSKKLLNRWFHSASGAGATQQR